MKKMDRLIIKEWLISLIYAVIIVTVLLEVFWPMRVKGSSMEDTLHDNNFIIVSKVLTWLQGYNYNDIVVLNYDHNGKKEKIVKRIIGQEGDHIQIKDGNVYRNENLLDEEYIKGPTNGSIDIYVPEESLFVLGDNRSISKDSRLIGCFNVKDVRGKVVMKLFPLGNIYDF